MLPEIHNEFAETEDFLAVFMSLILSESVVVLYAGCSQDFQEDRSWYYFRSSADSEFCLSLQQQAEKLPTARYFTALLSMSEKLSSVEDKSSADMLQVESISFDPEEEHLFLVFDLNGGWCGNFFFAGDLSTIDGARYNDNYLDNCRSLLWPKSISYHFELFLQLLIGRDDLVNGANLLPLETNFYLKENLKINSQKEGELWALAVKAAEGNLVLTLLESVMIEESKKQDTVDVSLSVGNIEISSDQILQLRPGTEIEIEETEAFQGIMKVEGHDYAYVTVIMEDQQPTIRIDQIITLSEAINSTLHETSEKKPRLIDRVNNCQSKEK